MTLEGGIAVQSGGQVLLGGVVQVTGTAPGVVPVIAVCRLNNDGSPDTGFGDAGEVIEDFGSPRNTQEFGDFGSVLVQPADGNVVLTGLTNLGFSVARLNGATSIIPFPPPLTEPHVASITAPTPAVATGTSLTVSAAFTFQSSSAPCTAIWSWGDGTTSTGSVSESTTSGVVTGTHVYHTGGAYPISLTVTDSRGASGQSSSVPGVLVRQPVTGSLNGNIHLLSPPGALPNNSSVTGIATLQLEANWSATGKPKGKVVLKLKPAHLSFTSAGIDALAIGGKTVWLEGTGTANGAESVRFLASAGAGGKGSGRIRLELWDEATGAVVYDNQPGAPVDAAPTASFRSGALTLHTQLSPKHAKKGIKQ